MKGFLAIVLIFAFGTASFGQGKYDANWCFGYKCGIDFSSGNPNTFISHSDCFETNISISDSAGKLLFYASSNLSTSFYDRITFYNELNNLIPNGDSIKNNASITNGAIILPTSHNKFYVFHLNHENSGQSIYYSIIQKDNNSSFHVKEKNVLLNDSTLVEEKLSAVKHANGKDWWIFTHGLSSNTFLRFLLKNDTIFGPFYQNIGGIHGTSATYGQMNFSRDGNRMSIVLSGDGRVGYSKFNRCTGLFSDYNEINIGLNNLYGCEFSSSGTYLYISNARNGFAGLSINALYQYNFDDGSIFQLAVDSTNGMDYGQLRRGPNGKVYLAQSLDACCPNTKTFFNQRLGVVNAPDSAKSKSNFLQNSFFLGDSAIGYIGLPNMPNYNLGPISIYAANAGNDSQWCKDSITGVSIGSPTVANIIYSWSPNTGLSNTDIAQPLAHPDSSTYYVLTVTDTSHNGSSCASRTDTVFVQVVKCDTTGIGEIGEAHLKIYPNPASKQLIIETTGSQPTVLYLYDYLGQVALQQPMGIGTSTLDVSALPQGLYLYRVGGVIGRVMVVR